VTATGAGYLEAPFTGSKPAAEARQVVFYLGGSPAAIEAAEGFLAPVSSARLVIGSCPQAAALKLAMNLQIALQAGALCESLSFARQAGISDEVFFGALRKNAAWSGLTALKEPKLRQADYAPQFSVKHMLKDMRLLLEESGPAWPPLACEIEQVLARCAEGGDADQDFIAMMKQGEPKRNF
jgi:3-hydroxyisobutyrate dehydrogenase-like beta-hydroxyacid dehydrogenase